MKNEVVTMEREVAVNVTALNKLLNADPNTPRRVAAPVETPRFTLTLEQMQAQARQYCCILLAALRTVQAREAGIKVAKLESAPDFEFRIEARQFNGQGGIQEYDTGVFINFPWLWRGKYKAMVNEAEADLDMSRAEFESELNMTMFDVKELHTNADTAMRLMGLYEKTVLPQARQLVEASRAGYETGGSTFLELVDAQKALLDAELAYERARAAYGRNYAKLDTIIGNWGEREYATGLVTKDMK
jgi:outer membrane protein TolC